MRKNNNEIISKIKNAAGTEPRIISGDEEASYIYKGVTLLYTLEMKNRWIIDIGGGSVEFIIGNGEEIS